MGNKATKQEGEGTTFLSKAQSQNFVETYARYCHAVKVEATRGKELALEGNVEVHGDAHVFRVATVSPVGTPLAPVDLAQKPLVALLAARHELEHAKLSAPIYANPHVCSHRMHGLLAACYEAFAFHRPLHLSPDHVWLTIAQGFANHVSQNAEELRAKFVEFEGKKEIVVRADEFEVGSDQNDWGGKIDAFTQGIAGHIGDELASTIVNDFSTSSPIDKAASGIVLMDAMKSYFSYTLQTMCGIPEIAVSGTLEDWEKVCQRAASLAKYGLEWWTARLEPILAQFVRLKRDQVVDVVFWDALYKFYAPGGGSGAHPEVTGWIVDLFPYLKDANSGALVRNDFRRAPLPENIPGGVNKAPMKWLYHDQTFKMGLYGGFFGLTQTEQNRVCPNVGYVILRETGEEEGKEPEQEREGRADDEEKAEEELQTVLRAAMDKSWRGQGKDCLPMNDTGCGL